MPDSIVFDRVAAVYDRSRFIPDTHQAAVADGIAGLTGATPDSRFFEIGIGTGRIALPLLRRGARYVGIDLSLPMMAVLRDKSAGATNLCLAQADATRLPFADAAFDIGIVAHVFHLIPNWTDAAEELCRVVDPRGGIVICSTARDEPGDGFRQAWREITQRHGVVMRRRGAEHLDTAIRHFVARGAKAEERTLTTWTIDQPIADAFELLKSRTYSSTWSVDDAVYAAMIDELAAWIENHVADPTAPRPFESRFRACRISGWGD